MNDFGKIAVIAGILGALLLFGVFTRTTEPVVIEPVPVAVEEPVGEVTILPQQTLEMLDPVYSEKAIFHDKTIRIAFQGAFSEDGVESKLPFWIHNVSDDVINILWDRCSIQLPGGNTVNIVNEGGPDYFAPVGRTISIAPAGDLFDAFIPVSEIVWTGEAPTLTTNVLDGGTFSLVLAIERAAGGDFVMMHREMPMQQEPCYDNEDMGRDGARMLGQRDMVMPMIAERDMAMSMPGGREVVYYTFRFVLR
ncbi:hypothetical protein ACFLSG_01010 [Candidatus Bipolaricaulota bacterium]